MNGETIMRNRGRGAFAAPAERSDAAGGARLRDRIDRGAGGDKVAFKDPAAAPLGTDDEAAGTPPSAAQVSAAMQQEAARSEETHRKSGPADLQTAGSRQLPWGIIAGLVALAILALAAMLA